MTTLPATQQHNISAVAHGRRTITRGVVIHTIEGPAASAISWFDNPQAQGLGAQVVIGLDKCWQLTDLDNICWHAVGANHEYIGFEHEGSADQSKTTWLKRRKQRKMSANRTAWVCWRYALGMPSRRKNVFGHIDFPQGGHHDPGPNFPWMLYMLAARRAYKRLVKTQGKQWS